MSTARLDSRGQGDHNMDTAEAGLSDPRKSRNGPSPHVSTISAPLQGGQNEDPSSIY